jgi:hypothetical protein
VAAAKGEERGYTIQCGGTAHYRTPKGREILQSTAASTTQRHRSRVGHQRAEARGCMLSSTRTRVCRRSLTKHRDFPWQCVGAVPLPTKFGSGAAILAHHITIHPHLRI